MSQAALLNLPTDPVVLGPRFRYEEIVARIVAANGQWVRIHPDEVTGAHNGIKQTVILQAARLRGLKFTTSFRCPPWLCARLVIKTGVDQASLDDGGRGHQPKRKCHDER